MLSLFSGFMGFSKFSGSVRLLLAFSALSLHSSNSSAIACSWLLSGFKTRLTPSAKDWRTASSPASLCRSLKSLGKGGRPFSSTPLLKPKSSASWRKRIKRRKKPPKKPLPPKLKPPKKKLPPSKPTQIGRASCRERV